MTATQIKDVIEKCIKELSVINFDVNAVVTDMGSNFIDLSNILGITAENPSFDLDSKKNIFFYFDPPHLI
jgi:hypothetical protein